jgi:hypothetical protein
MKIIFLCLFLFPLAAMAQQDTTMVEQYCQLVCEQRAFSKKVNVDIDFGEERKLFSDTRMRDEEGRIKKFNGVVDALNFMARQGWSLVNAYPLISGSQTTYHYVFKKYFKKGNVGE